MKFRLLFVFLLVGICSFAQPIFDHSTYAPRSGDQLKIGQASGVSAGVSGANQFWDFSSSSILSTVDYTVTSSSSVPCSADYPSATQTIGKGGGYEMIDVTTSEYNYYGTTLTPSMSDVVFSDPRKIFQYPMNFNDSFNDSYFGSNSIPVFRYGNSIVVYDGYGTLKTPYGTYPNSIRIHVSYSESDSTGGVVNCSSNRDYYYWYSPLYHYPVATIWNSNGSCSYSTGSEFLQSVTVGVKDENAVSSFEIYPTNVTDIITLRLKDNLNRTVSVYDLHGILVKRVTVNNVETKIDVSNLLPGMYFVQIGQSKPEKIIKL